MSVIKQKTKVVMLTTRVDADRRKFYERAAKAERRAGDTSVRSLSTWIRKHLDRASGYVER